MKPRNPNNRQGAGTRESRRAMERVKDSCDGRPRADASLGLASQADPTLSMGPGSLRYWSRSVRIPAGGGLRPRPK